MTSTSGVEGFAPDALSEDGFLGGRLRLLQPRKGYRAGVDPVLLAAAVPAQAGQAVLELGCGAGAALFCLGSRVAGLELHGIEVQPAYAALARENAARNGIAAEVHLGDLSAMPAALKAVAFDHVLANPPYHLRDRGTQAADAGRARALAETRPVGDWVAAGLRRLRPGGTLTLIQQADRLPEVLAGAGGHEAAVLPVASRAGRPASRVILRIRKGGRAPFRLLSPLVLHEGPAHLKDGEDYAPAVRAVLREGAPIRDFDV